MRVCSQAPIKVVEVQTLSKSTRTSRLQPLLGTNPLESAITSAGDVQSVSAGPPTPESSPPAVKIRAVTGRHDAVVADELPRAHGADSAEAARAARAGLARRVEAGGLHAGRVAVALRGRELRDVEELDHGRIARIRSASDDCAAGGSHAVRLTLRRGVGATAGGHDYQGREDKDVAHFTFLTHDERSVPRREEKA